MAQENRNSNEGTSKQLKSGTVKQGGQRPVYSRSTQDNAEKRTLIIVIAVVAIILLGILVSLYYLLQPQTDTEKIRDVFIIFMALESILLGVTLVVLMIQLAKLINLLQHEVLPILEATNETVSNIRGTAEFLGENITEPVIKLNSYTAGITRFLQVMGLTRSTKKSKGSKPKNAKSTVKTQYSNNVDETETTSVKDSETLGKEEKSNE